MVITFLKADPLSYSSFEGLRGATLCPCFLRSSPSLLKTASSPLEEPERWELWIIRIFIYISAHQFKIDCTSYYGPEFRSNPHGCQL